MENKNITENVTTEPKKKKNILGKMIGWLIVLAIFGGLGYLIYQNGGIPEEGLNLGEMIGTQTPKGLVDEDVLAELERMKEREESGDFDNPLDYEVVKKLMSIESAAVHRLGSGYGYLYHIDSTEEYAHSNIHKSIITDITGITDFSNIVGVATSSNMGDMSKAYLSMLIEFKEGTDTKEIAKMIKESVKPSEWSHGSEEYNASFDCITPEDVVIEAKGKYIYMAVMSEDLVGPFKAASAEKLGKTFLKLVSE